MMKSFAEYSRRDFLKLSALAGAYLFIPKTIRAFGSENFQLSISEVETGETLSGQTVTLFDQFGAPLGTGHTVDGVADFTITDVKDSQRVTGANVQHNNIAHTISYNLGQSSNVDIKMYNILGQEVKTLKSSGVFAGTHNVGYDLRGLASGFYNIRITNGEYVAQVPFVFDGQHVSPKPVKVSYLKKLQQEPGRLLKPTTDEMYAVISDTRHFDRTVRGIPADARSVDDRYSAFVEQDGVSPELYKAFVEAVNTHESSGSNGLAYTGLKTFFPHMKNGEEVTWWIAAHGFGPETVNAEEQQYVKNAIETMIHPYIEEGLRPQFYLEDPSNYEDLPLWQDNVILVVPGDDNGKSCIDNDSNGSIDSAAVLLDKKHIGYNDANLASILQETVSALVGPSQGNNSQYNHFSGLTCLSGSGYATDYLTAMDTKLLAMGQYHKGKEQLDDMLGIE